MRPELRIFLDRRFPGCRVHALAGDASTRRFYRLEPADEPSRIVMDYGRPFEDITDDVRLTRIFRAAGLRVAEILDVAPAPGCLILEDLGDLSLAAALDAPGADRRGLLERAVALAAAVAGRGTPALAGSDRRDGPALDADRFRFEMDFFLEHYAAGLCRKSPSRELRRSLEELADQAAETPRPVLCHRDFHGRNVMVLDGETLAMVDIQDARWGPDTYDLASLLCDAYVDFPENWEEPLSCAYRTALGAPPPSPAFRLRLHTVGAQRMLKALGTFGFQVHELGNERYRASIPRTTNRLRRWLAARSGSRPLEGLLLREGLLEPS